MIRSVLFDLGNVLVRFDPSNFWSFLGVDDKERQGELKPPMLELGRIYESGGIGTEEFRQRFHGLFSGAFSGEKLDEAFLGVLTEHIEGTDDLVRRVAKRCEVSLVSNTNPIHFDLCLRATPALKHFDRFHLSYELGVLKPHDDFYAGVIRREGWEPGEMVFIDDLEENVEAAKKAGFAGLRFTDAVDLERRLKELGIL